MDFITGLLESHGCTNMMVITDRLSKGAIFIPMRSIDTEAVVEAFKHFYMAHHALPAAIVSD